MNTQNRILEAVKLRAVNEDSRTVEFVASDNSVDSYGTVLPVDKWDLSRFEKNPVIGYQHELYGSLQNNDPDTIIGKGEAFIEDDQLIIRITFEPKELNEKADKIYRKILFGTMNGVSVGFVPTNEGHWGNKRDGEAEDVYYFDGQQLLEVSVVNIPANANAVRRSIDDLRASLPQKEDEGCKPKKKEEGEDEDDETKKPEEERDYQDIITIARATLAKCNR